MPDSKRNPDKPADPASSSGIFDRLVTTGIFKLESTAMELRRLKAAAEAPPDKSTGRRDEGNAPAGDPATGSGPGAVEHDARGNAVWRWAVSAGISALDSTTRLLKKLEAPELDFADNASDDKTRDATADRRRDSRRSPDTTPGYDPYNRGGPRRGGR